MLSSMDLDRLPILRDRHARLWCSGLPDDGGGADYGVPVTNELGRPPSKSARELLTSQVGDLAEDDPFVRFYSAHNGARLMVRPEPYEHEQDKLGSMLLTTIEEFSEVREELETWVFDWIDDGQEDPFVPWGYTWEDVLPFGCPNYSPDRWYIVIRGEHAGRYGLWEHDGVSIEGARYSSLTELLTGWAEDLSIAFGGICRFEPGAADPPAPQRYRELFPIRYSPC